MCVCARMCVLVHVCVFVYVCMLGCALLSVFVHVRVQTQTHVCMRMYDTHCASVPVCICVRACVCARVCIHNNPIIQWFICHILLGDLCYGFTLVFIIIYS